MTDAAAERALQLSVLFVGVVAVGMALRWQAGPTEREEQDRKAALDAKPELVKQKRLREPRPPSMIRKVLAIGRWGEMMRKKGRSVTRGFFNGGRE